MSIRKSFGISGFLQRRGSTAIFIAADPIICSACIFLLQTAIITTSPKIEFALFSLSYSYVVMGQAILAGIFGGPIITLLSQRGHDDASENLGRALLRANLTAAVFMGGVAMIVGVTLGFSKALIAATLSSFLLLSFRDAARGVLICRSQGAQTFRLALGFAAVSLTYVAISFWGTGRINAIDGLAAIALGAGITMLPTFVDVMQRKASFGPKDRRELAGMAVWSFPGSIIIWMQNSFYLTIIAKNLGMEAVGEISAARLVIMPILVASGALMRMVQARSARLLSDGGHELASRAARRLALPTAIAGTVLTTMVLLTAPWIPLRWLPVEHPHILPLAACWIGFASFTIARGLYSSFYQAMGRYRELFSINLVSLPFVLAGVAIGPKWIGLYGAILPLAFGELFMLSIMKHRESKIASSRNN